MKKVIGILLVVSLCLTVFTALADSPVGIWYLNAIQISNLMIRTPDSDDDGLILILRKGGELIIILNGNEGEGKWSQKGNRVIFNNEGKAVLHDGVLTMDGDESGIQLILGREKQDDLDEYLPLLLLNSTIDDFIGAWSFYNEEADVRLLVVIDDKYLNFDNQLVNYTITNGVIEVKQEEGTIKFRLHQDGRMSFSDQSIGIMFLNREYFTSNSAKNHEKVQKVKITHTGAVNVRKSSNVDSEKVGTAKSGGIYTYLDTSSNGWYRIRLENGKEGWISGKMAVVFDAPTTSDQSTSLKDVTPPVAQTKLNDSSSKQQAAQSFREAMDNYELFFTEYVEFIKKYSESGYSLSMLSDYIDFMSKYTDMVEKMEAINDDELSTADYAYYIEVTTRIYKMLAEAL